MPFDLGSIMGGLGGGGSGGAPVASSANSSVRFGYRNDGSDQNMIAIVIGAVALVIVLALLLRK